MKNKNKFNFLKNNKKIIFLDSATTTLKPKVVLKSLIDYYDNFSYGIFRGKNLLGSKNEEIFKKSIKNISNFINSEEEEILFSSGTTDGINKIVSSLKNKFKKGDEIILGDLEHASNYLPWIYKLKEIGVKILHYKLNENFELDLKYLEKIISEKTKVISISHKFNSTGSVNDIYSIRKIIGPNVIFLVDATQSITTNKIDVKKINCDFLFFSGHKMFATNGIGVIYANKNILKVLEPFEVGGGMNLSYDKNSFKLKEGISKFYSGSLNLGGIVAMSESINFIEKMGGVEKINIYTSQLKIKLEKKLETLDNVQILNKGIKTNILMFKIKGVSDEDVSFYLSKKNILIRSGDSCVKTLKNKLKVKNFLRVSFQIYNNERDIEKFYKAIKNGGDFIDVLF